MSIFLKEYTQQLDRKCVDKIYKLKQEGVKSGKLLEKQNILLERDLQMINKKQLSGCKYLRHQGDEDNISSLASKYIYQNPLHFNIFPSARQMEIEVLQMIGNELGQTQHNGLVLQDDIEVATMVLLSARQKARQQGLYTTQVLLGQNASSCWVKAASILNVTLVIVAMDNQ